MKTITLVGFTILFFYCVIQIFKFFGIEQHVYSDYLLFYGILLLSVVFLPNNIPDV
jgi:hypothetical protein